MTSGGRVPWRQGLVSGPLPQPWTKHSATLSLSVLICQVGMMMCPHSTVGRANQGDVHRGPRCSKDYPFSLLLPSKGPAAMRGARSLCDLVSCMKASQSIEKSSSGLEIVAQPSRSLQEGCQGARAWGQPGTHTACSECGCLVLSAVAVVRASSVSAHLSPTLFPSLKTDGRKWRWALYREAPGFEMGKLLGSLILRLPLGCDRCGSGSLPS